MPKGWLKPNQGKPYSFDSGLSDIEACEGASVKLRPIWSKADKLMRIRWQVLAAISKVESDFGCNMGPSSAGAIGWTQFMPATWKDWGTDADGDGKADPRNAVDAVFSSARYLRASGAPKDYRKAIFAYNRADWYVRKILATAETFEEFSLEEFDEAVVLSEEARELDRRIKEARGRLAKADQKEAKMLRALRKSQNEYKLVEQAAQEAEEQFKRDLKELNTATTGFINISQGVSNGDARQDEDTQILAYTADSKAQDAVLVYQLTAGLLESQGEAMIQLRNIARQAHSSQLKAEGLVIKYEALTQERVEQLLQAQTGREERKGALETLREDKDLYQKTIRSWNRRYGSELAGNANALDNPLSSKYDDLSIGERMVRLARDELKKDVKETPDGSNDSPDISRYRSAIIGNPGPGPWCAYFISYLAKRAGHALGDRGQGFGLVRAMEAQAKKEKQWLKVSEARAGDIIFFVEHMGLVEKVEDGKITTIEGNASNAVSRREDRAGEATGLWRVERR
jgi:hypothetical protein